MITMNSAFRLRNKLKERIRDLNGMISSADYEKTVGEEENTSAFDGKTFNEVVVEITSLMDTLRELNRAIEKSNEINRDDLVILETLKAKISLYQQLLAGCRFCKSYRIEYPSTSDEMSGTERVTVQPVRVPKEPLLDQKKLSAEMQALQKEKDVLEEKLAQKNFSTQVDFDGDTVLSAL